MSDFDADSLGEFEWNDRGDLAWNEFDWERYLKEQDQSVGRYLGFYEECKDPADRIDWVAAKMGWEISEPDESPAEAAEEMADDAFAGEGDVYTLHQNPVFIATRALYFSLKRTWSLAATAERAPLALALSLQESFGEGEGLAVQAIHALDFGDYAMAVSLFKRALAELNRSLALLQSVEERRSLRAFREYATPRLFDLREIWLRVVAECRDELERPREEED